MNTQYLVRSLRELVTKIEHDKRKAQRGVLPLSPRQIVGRSLSQVICETVVVPIMSYVGLPNKISHSNMELPPDFSI